MANRLVVGAQWGDEGKGKVVDLLAQSADWVARFSGGANAGHTVKIKDQSFALHLIPTGILAPDTRCLIGNGVVIDLTQLFAEIETLRAGGVEFDSRLLVSASAHLVLPHHKLLEAHGEQSETDAQKIGTTMRGIGPAYADKIARRGVRIADLMEPQRLQERVGRVMAYWDTMSNGILSRNGCTLTTVVDELLAFQARIAPMMVDCGAVLDKAIKAGQSILFEGAQGALLDIDFGTYPYVTSSNTTTGGAFTGLGISPRSISEVIGVVKAYTTRVGNGPFPTELTGDAGEHLRQRGNEFGTTTGRSRRCGWLDLVALKYAVRLNGITHIAITKLDVLDQLETIDVCVGYRIGNRESTEMPVDMVRLEDATPIYRSFPGWKQTTAGMTEYDELPATAREYLKFICDALAVKLTMVSTGPKRSETIRCDKNPVCDRRKVTPAGNP